MTPLNFGAGQKGKPEFVLRRHSGGWKGYVAPPGGKSSYVTQPRHARKFATREEADVEKCENESVVELRHEM